MSFFIFWYHFGLILGAIFIFKLISKINLIFFNKYVSLAIIYLHIFRLHLSLVAIALIFQLSIQYFYFWIYSFRYQVILINLTHPHLTGLHPCYHLINRQYLYLSFNQKSQKEQIEDWPKWSHFLKVVIEEIINHHKDLHLSQIGFPAFYNFLL